MNHRDPPGYRGKHSRRMSDNEALAYLIAGGLSLAAVFWLIAEVLGIMERAS